MSSRRRATRLLALLLVIGSLGGGVAGARPHHHKKRAAPAATVADDGTHARIAGTILRDGGASLVVRAVTVNDFGRFAWRGDVDLAPVLRRIARGQRDPHRDDSTVFGNREHLLPDHDVGWWREYVVRTPGVRGPGPQRLILGRGGELFYTPDHYQSFVKLR